MTNDFQRDLIAEIFGDRPELAFQGSLGRAGAQGQLGAGQERFLRGRASDFLSRLQSQYGQQMLAGGLPTLTPEKFFGDIDFRNELYRFSPEQRGMGTSQFAPFTQFRFGR